MEKNGMRRGEIVQNKDFPSRGEKKNPRKRPKPLSGGMRKIKKGDNQPDHTTRWVGLKLDER